MFAPFASHPSFSDLASNLQTIITFFNSKLEQIQEKKERTLSVGEVQDVIRQTAMQFPKEKLTVSKQRKIEKSRSKIVPFYRKLQKFPELKFKYVEEDQPEDFFVPYVWSLAGKKFNWNEASVKLISQE